MEVRTDFPSSMYHTKLQWAQLGKALNADAVGIEMWVNSCQINRAIFYTVDEVHNGTQTELDEVLEPLRKKAEASRVCLEHSTQLLCLTFDVFSFLCDMYLAFFFQAVHDSFEFPFLIFRDLKQHRQLFQLHRHIKFVTDKFINNFSNNSSISSPVKKGTPYRYYRVFLIFFQSFVMQKLSGSGLLQVQ